MTATASAEIGHNRPPLPEVLRDQFAPLAAEVEAMAKRANSAPRKISTDADLDAIGGLIRDSRALERRVDQARTAEKAPFLQAGREIDGFFKVMTDRLNTIASAFQAIADQRARELAAAARRKAEEDARKAREEEERQRDIARRAEEANRLKTADKHEAKADAAAVAAEQAAATANATAADLTRTRTESGLLSTARTEWNFEIENATLIPFDRLLPYLKREHIEQAVRAYVRFHKNASPLPGVRIFEDVKASFR